VDVTIKFTIEEVKQLLAEMGKEWPPGKLTREFITVLQEVCDEYDQEG